MALLKQVLRKSENFIKRLFLENILINMTENNDISRSLGAGDVSNTRCTQCLIKTVQQFAGYVMMPKAH